MRRIACFICVLATFLSPAARAAYRVATFEADVTIPIGHACMGGGIENAKEIVDPLYAKGFVLTGDHFDPVVIVALDWCQCNNDSYDRWRDVLAEAAKTSRVRVMLATVHQHDAPICDPRAQAILDGVGMKGSICDMAFHERAVQRAAAALKEALGRARNVTHVGVGQARIERLASNRRVIVKGKTRWDRTSADKLYDDQPEGEVDPFLKTISLWDGDTPVLAWSCFAIHPMSHYGKGLVSADFVGRARAMRQAEEPGVFQIYFTGCGGDVTAGKYNDGKPEETAQLADRLHAGMLEAWKATKRVPMSDVTFRTSTMRFSPRAGADFEPARMREIIADTKLKRWLRNSAAFGLSWRERLEAGRPIDVPCADFGPGAAQFVVMPAETFVAYQLAAQKMRPDGFVVVAGFGDGAPGYIPTDACVHDGWDDAYSWVEPPVDKTMIDALRAALNAPQ